MWTGPIFRLRHRKAFRERIQNFDWPWTSCCRYTSLDLPARDFPRCPVARRDTAAHQTRGAWEMEHKLTFAQKVSRLGARLRDREWRRYGTLLLAGKAAAIAI